VIVANLVTFANLAIQVYELLGAQQKGAVLGKTYQKFEKTVIVEEPPLTAF
jgi:hypothetical protein